jgi:hypothetical protein
MKRTSVASFASDPYPNPPPLRGRGLTEFAASALPAAARAVRLLWESGAAGSFLPLKGGGSRWGSRPESDAAGMGLETSSVR